MGALGTIAELRAAAEPLAEGHESDSASDAALRKRMRHWLARTALPADSWTFAIVQVFTTLRYDPNLGPKLQDRRMQA